MVSCSIAQIKQSAHRCWLVILTLIDGHHNIFGFTFYERGNMFYFLLTTITIWGHRWGDHPHCLSAYAIFQRHIHSHSHIHIYLKRNSPLVFILLVLLTTDLCETNSIILHTESCIATLSGFFHLMLRVPRYLL